VDLIGIEPMTSSMPSNYRRHRAYEPVQSAKPAQSAIFAAKVLPNLQPAGHGLIVWDQPQFSLAQPAPIPGLEL
jgi:hypothetical protein